jgi:hypothetical protein
LPLAAVAAVAVEHLHRRHLLQVVEGLAAVAAVALETTLGLAALAVAAPPKGREQQEAPEH